MNIDIKQLIPEFLLDSKRMQEFLDVLNSEIEESLQKIKAQDNLLEVDVIGDYLNLLMQNFHMVYEYFIDLETNKFLLKQSKDFYNIKSSLLFFDNFLKLIGSIFLWVDLGKSIIVLSQQQKLSEGFIQDATYYRDGVLHVTASAGDITKLQLLLEKYIAAGIYVWFDLVIRTVFSKVEIMTNSEEFLIHADLDTVELREFLSSTFYEASINGGVNIHSLGLSRYPYIVLSNNFVI